MKAKSIAPLPCLLITVVAMIAASGLAAKAGDVTLEDQTVLVAFDGSSGALTRLEYKVGPWAVQRRPELGVSFRLFAPLPDRRYNPVFGRNQHSVKINKVSDREIRLQWDHLTSETGGVLPMTLTADVTLTQGVLRFAATLKNDSSLPVETIDFPYLGDLTPPSPDSLFAARTLSNDKTEQLQSDEVYPHFRNEKGYWGVNYPTKVLEPRRRPCCLLQASNCGLLVAPANSKPGYRLQYTFEQHPGVISAVSGLVPRTDYISGWPVHLEFRVCHFIFAQPHSTTKLVPIVLQCYRGDSREGLNLYTRDHPANSN